MENVATECVTSLLPKRVLDSLTTTSSYSLDMINCEDDLFPMLKETLDSTPFLGVIRAGNSR